MVKSRVAVVFGGTSVEREVSRVSARAILHGLGDAFDAIPIGMDASGRFRNERDSRILLETGFGSLSPDAGGTDPWRIFQGVGIAFPIVHGEGGEDGTLQGFFETIGLPYVGSGVAGSALGMNKVAFKARMREAGIPVVRSISISKGEWISSAASLADSIARRFPLPVFVKPSNGGSSLGITKVKDWSALAEAARLAFEYDDAILVEEGIDAREIETAILGNEEPEASGCAEIVPGREFYDYEDKYLADSAKLLVPAPLDEPFAREARATAIRAFLLAGCSGMARVDFFLDRRTGSLLLNEINTLPGFTAISQYPRLWAEAGVSLPELLGRLVRLGFERSDARRKAIERRGSPPKIA
ncbi:MAG: D-alanine--D-alanine ligase family protein [Thermoanaerobaculia bacterium]